MVQLTIEKYSMGHLCFSQLLKTQTRSHSSTDAIKCGQRRHFSLQKWARKGIKMFSLWHTSLFLSFWHLCCIAEDFEKEDPVNQT